MNSFLSLRALLPATSSLRTLPALVVAISLGSPRGLAQTTFTDADVLTEIANSTTGTSETSLEYIIGNSGAYDTDLGGAQFFLQNYTQLTIQSGSTVNVGDNNGFGGDNNTVIVTGDGTQYLLKTSTSASGFLFTASSINNTVQILDGGYALSGGIKMAGSINPVTASFEISGTDSILETRFAPNLTSVSELTVDISSGGLWDAVNFGTAGDITVNLNSGGTLQTSGAFTVSNIDTFNFASGGTLIALSTVTDLGTITSGQTVDITGGGSFANATTLDGGTLLADDADLTNLTLTSGTLSATGALTNLNSLSSSSQSVVIDGGSWSPTGSISTGNLTIQDSGAVTVTDYSATNLTFTSGTLTATGALTNLNSLSSANQSVVIDGGSWSPTGDIATGNLTIDNSGAVTVTDYSATNLTFTSGTLTATGALTNLNTLSSSDQTVVINGGSWSPSGTIGAGNLTLQNAGAVTVGDYDATNLTLTSGTLTTTGALTNLNTLSSSSQTIVVDGGTWSPTGNIDDGNLTIQNDGSVSIGTAYDATNLTFTAGSLTIAGDASNLPTISSGRTVTLTGDGSLLTATTLNGGTLTGGDFDLDGNLTFTAGTLNVSGTLENLTHLPSGSEVNMSGASADLILSQDLVITGGTLNIDNSASVTVLNDITLGAGLLGFDSNGGNLDLDGGILNVASMDTTLTLNANASVTGNGSIFGNVSLGVGGTIDGDATGLRIFGDVSGSGTLADTTLYGALNIGNSPGDIYLENTTLSSSTIIALAIEGASVGEFDRLFIDDDSDVSEATLNITFDGYTPESLGLTFAIISNDSGTDFATISTPSGWALNSSGVPYNTSAVPEPSTYALLFGAAALTFAASRRRQRRPQSTDKQS